MDAAVAALAAVAPTPRAERVPVAAATGRTLARDVVATTDLPRSDVSAMDGYAVRATDTAAASDDAPVPLRRVGGSYAGAPFDGTVGPGEAVAIATGASVPAGADAIVLLEATALDGDVVTVRAPGVAKHVRRRGEDVAAGATTTPAGTLLGPAGASLLAAMGHAEVPVARPPRAAVVVTGSEVGRAAGGARDGVFDSNGPLLAGLLARLGAEVASREAVADDADALAAALDRAAASGADLIVTTGGASVGRFDLVRRALADGGAGDGADADADADAGTGFDRVLVKPGGPAMLGAHRGVPWLGLPGTPVAVTVVGGVLLDAWVHAALGRSGPPAWGRPAHAVVDAPVRGDTKKVALWTAHVRTDEAGVRRVRELGRDGASRLATLPQANGLLRLPAGASHAAGDVAEVLPVAFGA
ncbi:MAG: molybdopterin molybdotransferase MoeA [Trueperaceae bacterium]|nr:molybdopterin molybdotransferase MoeA [Trueperaceae bacterium]